MLDRLFKKYPLLVVPFNCMLCQKVEEDLDHILCCCEFSSGIRVSFYTFGSIHIQD
ncbi:hypothetical protein IC582_022054 [Cucumis melo]